MEYRSQEIKAGLLVVLSFAVLVAFLVTITGVEWERQENVYSARFGFSAGIEPGSLVRFGGMLVGAVTESYIAPDDNTKIEVIMRVGAQVPVKTDSYAFITSINLMGDYYVEITTGTPVAVLLPSGSRLQSRDVAILSQLGEPLSRVSDEVEALLGNLNDLLNERNRAHLSNMVSNADTMLARNMRDISGIVTNLKLLTEQLQGLSSRVDKFMGDNASSLEQTVNQLRLTLSRADTLMQDLSDTMQSVANLVATNETAFYEVMHNMQEASHHFEQFGRSIKERPWNLVRKSEPAERKLP